MDSSSASSAMPALLTTAAMGPRLATVCGTGASRRGNDTHSKALVDRGGIADVTRVTAVLGV